MIPRRNIPAMRAALDRCAADTGADLGVWRAGDLWDAVNGVES